MATIPISRQPPWLDNDGATAKPSSGRGASGSSTNFTFLNHSITISPGCELQLCFHQFQELPLELRENIWAYSLPQQRLLTITVTGPRDYNAAPYSRKNNIGNIVSDASYRLHLDSTGIYTPQLYVNQEANRVTKRTYRVRVPRIGRSTSSNPSRLCFSPERDTILVTVEHEEDKAYFAHFVHDALAYDPQQKGILHMAIMSRDRSRTYLPIGESLPLFVLSPHPSAEFLLIVNTRPSHFATSSTNSHVSHSYTFRKRKACPPSPYRIAPRSLRSTTALFAQ